MPRRPRRLRRRSRRLRRRSRASHAAICLAGNHDLGVRGDLAARASSRAAPRSPRDWTQEMITPQTREYLDGARAATTVEETVGLYHASPRDPVWEYVLSPLLAELCLDVQAAARLPDRPLPRRALVLRARASRRPARRARADEELDIATANGCSTRAASASRATATRAPPGCCSTSTAWRAIYRRTEYDVAGAAAAIRAARLPDSLAERLRVRSVSSPARRPPNSKPTGTASKVRRRMRHGARALLAASLGFAVASRRLRRQQRPALRRPGRARCSSQLDAVSAAVQAGQLRAAAVAARRSSEPVADLPATVDTTLRPEPRPGRRAPIAELAPSDCPTTPPTTSRRPRPPPSTTTTTTTTTTLDDHRRPRPPRRPTSTHADRRPAPQRPRRRHGYYVHGQRQRAVAPAPAGPAAATENGGN